MLEGRLDLRARRLERLQARGLDQDDRPRDAGPTLAAALDIRPDRQAKPVPLQTISGLTQGQPVKIPSLRVGDAEVEDVIAVVHPLGSAMDGILGNTFLGRFTRFENYAPEVEVYL